MRLLSTFAAAFLLSITSLLISIKPAFAAYSTEGVDFRAAAFVDTLALDGNMLYMAGDFEEYGTSISRFTTLDVDTGDIATKWPHFNNEVYGIVSDGAGGWYVSGEFTKVQNQTQAYVAHINSDGSLDESFDPVLDAAVLTLAISSDGETLYLGGLFTEINGETRNYLASVATADGAVTAFDPDMADEVNEILLSADGAELYAIGEFTTVNGGTTRNYAAAFTIADSTATAFDPDLGGEGESIARNADTSEIYIGGWFTSVNGGTTRNYLASFDSSDGAATSFHPNLNSAVYALTLNGDDSILYASGAFASSAGGSTTRNYAAAFSTTTGLATNYNPNLSNAGLDIALSADEETVYISGSFFTVGGVDQKYFAAVDSSTGTRVALDPKVSSYLNAVELDSAGQLAFGGEFVYVNTVVQSGFAQYNLTTKSFTDVNIDLEKTIVQLAFNSDKSVLYLAGGIEYDLVQQRAVLGFDPVTETATDFEVLTDRTAYAIAISEDDQTIYVGGEFTEAQGEARDYFAAVAADGTLLDMDLALDGQVNTMVIDPENSILYIGGDFSSVLSQTRNKLAAIDLVTGELLDFDPDLDEYVSTLALSPDNSTLYIGGAFTTVGASNRSYFAGVSTSTGLATSLDLGLDAQVITLAIDPTDDILYLGGLFTTANSGTDTRKALAAINTNTGLLTNYAIDIENDEFPGEDTIVNAVLPSSDHLFIGGYFTRVATDTRFGLGWFPAIDTGSGDSGGEPDESSDIVSPAPSSEATSTPRTPQCTDAQPSSAPYLFQATRNGGNVSLYVTPPGGQVTGYRVLYGGLAIPGQYGASFYHPDSSGVVQLPVHDLNPLETYQFVVQAANGCSGGAWSNVLVVGSSSNALQTYYSSNSQIVQSTAQIGVAVLQNSSVPSSPVPTSDPAIPVLEATLEENIDADSQDSESSEPSTESDTGETGFWQRLKEWLRRFL